MNLFARIASFGQGGFYGYQERTRYPGGQILASTVLSARPSKPYKPFQKDFILSAFITSCGLVPLSLESGTGVRFSHRVAPIPTLELT